MKKKILIKFWILMCKKFESENSDLREQLVKLRKSEQAQLKRADGWRGKYKDIKREFDEYKRETNLDLLAQRTQIEVLKNLSENQNEKITENEETK